MIAACNSVRTCGFDRVHGAGFAAHARLGAADDAELVGGIARRPFPLEEQPIAGDVVLERHPVSDGAVLDDVVVDRDDAVLRRQPGDRQAAVHHQLSRHVERRIRPKTCCSSQFVGDSDFFSF